MVSGDEVLQLLGWVLDEGVDELDGVAGGLRASSVGRK